MKLLGTFLLLAAAAMTTPAAGEAQVRVEVNLGLGRYNGYHGYRSGYDRWHRVGRYPSYARYRSYPGEVVIVRRHVYRSPIVLRPRYHRNYRSYRHR
jgi:hypothetical protein